MAWRSAASARRSASCWGWPSPCNIEAIRQWLQHTFGLVLFDETLYLLAEMPSHITWQEVATIAGMAVVFALAASLYPAFRAARLDPVEGLRRE